MATPARHCPEEGGVSVVWSIIADKHCRQVIGYFRSADATVATLEELAQYAASDGPSSDPERKAVQFHHVTLPKLADAGVLEYDPRQRDVRYHGHDCLDSMYPRSPTGGSDAD